MGTPSRDSGCPASVYSLSCTDPPLSHSNASCLPPFSQLDVCRFYDLPFISLRDALLPELIAHPARVPLFYGRDGGGVNAGHVGTRGHWALGNMVAHYFLSELVSMAREGTLDVAPEELEESSDLDRDILDAERSIMKYDKDEQLEWRKTDLEEGVLEMQWGNELVHHDVPRVSLRWLHSGGSRRPHLAAGYRPESLTPSTSTQPAGRCRRGATR